MKIFPSPAPASLFFVSTPPWLRNCTQSWVPIMLTALILLLTPLGTLAGCPAKCHGHASKVLSCTNKTEIKNACCFNAPGGQLLQTQFWDTNPSTGPSDKFTIHGLWPDNCDGTYSQFCDPNRQYTNVTQILQSFGQHKLLKYMKRYWTDYQGQEESFWEHEFNKHGTCISTLEPSCYTNYTPQEEVVDFFVRTVELYKTLDTYKFLKHAGIVPTTSKNYTYDQITGVLAQAHGGHNVSIQCTNGTLDQVYYYFETKGSVPTGEFVPADPVGGYTTCPMSIMYLPKNISTRVPVVPVNSTATSSVPYQTSCRKDNF